MLGPILMLEINELTDQAFYTIAFGVTAHQLDLLPSRSDKLSVLKIRYENDELQLRDDLRHCPYVLSRLERLANEAPEGSITQVLALKYLEPVKRFGSLLEEYTKSIKR